MNEPISSAIQEVLDLYANELAPLQFGDLEPGALASAADEVRDVAKAVAKVEEALDKARAALAEKQDFLLQKAQRALAYARIYAEEQPELAARIERIALPRAARRPGKAEADPGVALPAAPALPRRRGRPRKAEAEGVLLGLEPAESLDEAQAG